MNVLQVLPELKIGGVERGTVELARYLVENDHKAVVVSAGGRLVRELDAIGARHYTLPIGKKSPFTMVRMVGNLCDIIRRENIDVVHARSRIPAWTAYFACRITQRPFITTAHGYYKGFLASQVMGWGKYVIVASQVIARHMIDDFNVPYSRVVFIPRGVDIGKFTYADFKTRRKLRNHSPKDDSFTVGVISRITPIKGHTHFIKALAVVQRAVPKLKVMIVGEPSGGKTAYKEELELLVRRLGLAGTVEFTGWREDIPQILSKLDLVVLPTVTQEAFGRVIVEAQASGVPVIGTKVGGISELIEDGRTGLLVPPEDVQSMQKAILRVAKDPDLAQSLSIEGRKSAEKYSLERMASLTLDVYKKAIESQNILVIKMSALGDVILSVPSLRAIRSRFPNAGIKVLVGLQSRQVFKGCPYIDETIVIDLKGRHRSPVSLLRLGTQLRRHNFDIAIDLQNNRRSHILSFLSLAHIRCGYDNGKFSFLLNRKAKLPDAEIDPVSHQFCILRLAGIKSDDKRLELWPQEEEREWAEKFLADNWVDTANTRLIGINPNASKRWISKNWPVGYVGLLCDELARRYNARIIITGTKEEKKMIEALRSFSRSKPIIAVGKTDLLQLAALIQRCRVFITTDSATMHVAAAVGTPFVALFGPTQPGRHVPALSKQTILKSSVKCRPCYKPTCKRGYECMKRITVADVVEAAGKYLSHEYIAVEHTS